MKKVVITGIGMLFAAASTAFCSSVVRPVVPITYARPLSAAFVTAAGTAV